MLMSRKKERKDSSSLPNWQNLKKLGLFKICKTVVDSGYTRNDLIFNENPSDQDILFNHDQVTSEQQEFDAHFLIHQIQKHIAEI